MPSRLQIFAVLGAATGAWLTSLPAGFEAPAVLRVFMAICYVVGGAALGAFISVAIDVLSDKNDNPQ